MRVLLVDHDPAVLSAAARSLQGLIDCAQVTSKGDCLARLREGGYDIVVACERLADGSGLDLLATLGLSEPDVLRIFAADGERLKKLGGHLAPFKLFDTIGYPLDSMQLRSAMALAIAERGDLMSGEFENIVLGSDAPAGAEPAAEAIEAFPQIVLLTRDGAALESAHAALADRPYRVIAARDADEARADLVARRPVLALVDVGTLGMDPVNWFAEAHRASPATHLIALGRRNDGQVLEPLVADGIVDRFVAKPVTHAGMRLVLDSALRLQSLDPARPAGTVATDRTAAPPSSSAFGDDDSLAGPVVRTSGAPLRTVDWQPADPVVRKASNPGSARADHHPGRLPLPAMLAMAGALAFGAAWFYFSRHGDPAAVPAATAAQATAAQATSPAAAASTGDQIVARIEDALTRGDLAAAQASLDELLRVEPQHNRRTLLATLVARAKEAQRLAKSPPATGDSLPAAMATTSIAPGATLPAPEPPPVPHEVERAPPVPPAATVPAAPAPDEPTTIEPATSRPAASPTDLRPSKLTAVSFAGRTIEDGPAPATAASSAAPTARPEPDRPQPVVMEMKLLRSAAPEYPEDARRKRLEGSVDLAFVVGADGKVKDVEVASSTAPGVFDAQAIAAVKHWRYDPRREDGVPVDHPAKVRLQFRLDE
jgi:protein TonB